MASVKAVVVELPAFDRHRAEYLSDEAFRMLQATLMKSARVLVTRSRALAVCANFALLTRVAGKVNAAACG